MKKIINLLIFSLITISAFCQVDFESLSFANALQKSKQTGKLIFLQFESDGCMQCNEVADKAFENKILREKLEQTFICIKITTEHPDRSSVASLYNKKDDNFGSLFIRSDGTLVHSYPGSTTLITTYQEHIDKALTAAGEGMRISELEKEYQSGNKSPGLIEILLQLKRTLNLETDSLLDEYVSILPADSFKSVRTLVFIAQMAPALDSKANIQLRKDYTLFNTAWQTISLPDRVGINNRIVSKSMQKASREKNESYALRVADFRRRTYGNDIKAGQKAFDYAMINYYLETKDSLNYLSHSVLYYDNYLMTVTVDSIKRQDSLNLKMILAKQPPPQPSQNGTTRQTVKYSPVRQSYNRELNNAASAFLEVTNDPFYLVKAIKWSERANEFFESYISMNTHALLLYKTGKKEEAIKWQTNSIELKKKQGFDTKKLEKELADMIGNN